ncbi:apoptosis regulator BAX-like [Synchiropus splendidus]|uniref:apoptosis regulator BAX-like n=1 Tax=Synchiropus splendidus TaxID=270530 RepID=UPI00237DBF7D|nr:apoptosis regulator BAX-like [Synchiropus splendidus]
MEEDDQGAPLTKAMSALLINFIHEEVQMSGVDAAVFRHHIEVEEIHDPALKNLLRFMRQFREERLEERFFEERFGKELPYLTREEFTSICSESFSNGRMTWSKLVLIFLFASRLVIRAITDNNPDKIKDIVGWTQDCTQGDFLEWCKSECNWVDYLSFVIKHNWKEALALLGVSLIIIFVICKY